jgi:hypothetical protein
MVSPSQLPPLILHPFSAGGSMDQLLEGSRAAVVLQGMQGHSKLGYTADAESELLRSVLGGRYQEIRMLLFLGKDLFRWMQQCVDFVGRSEGGDCGLYRRICEQSFAALVVEMPPACVQTKLQNWGVADRRAIFSRAIGINSLFSSPPPVETLSTMFLQNYHRYADHAYICYQHLKPFQTLLSGQFVFEIYASEEYARLLSEQWQRT